MTGAEAPSSPAALRNRGPILEVLRPYLPERGRVLEIASGTGEHAVYLSAALPGLEWLPTERDANGVAVLNARRSAEGPANLLAPVRLDAAQPDAWPDAAGDPPPNAIVCINMIHIAPWTATQGLFTGAARRLNPEGILFLYGPYVESDVPIAESNVVFHASLKARNPSWGLRRLKDVDDLAAEHGLSRVGRLEMPANNLSIVYRAAG